MGFFDTIKKFFSGGKTAEVSVLDIEGQPAGQLVIPLSVSTLRGRMRVTAQEDCVMLGTSASIKLRTHDKEEDTWSDVEIASGDVKEERTLKAGDTFEQDWQIDEIQVARYLRYQEYEPNDAIHDDSVKFIVECTADVKGSPFDPSGEVEVKMGPQEALAIKTTVIEGQDAQYASFPVTDSVLKGTVVVTGHEDTVLTATKYQIILRIDGQEILVAHDQDPELNPNPLSVSFGGTNIDFPKKLKPYAEATQTWMVSDIDLPAELAKHGIAEPGDAVGSDRVELVVRTLANTDTAEDVASCDVVVQLT